MTLTTNLFFQALALAIQSANMATNMVPHRYQPYVALFIGVAQAVVAWRAHYFNTDGTPQSVGKF